jgi:hypothetical protein
MGCNQYGNLAPGMPENLPGRLVAPVEVVPDGAGRERLSGHRSTGLAARPLAHPRHRRGEDSNPNRQICSLVLRVDLVGSRRICPAHVGSLVDRIGSRRNPSDRLDDQADDQASQAARRTESPDGARTIDARCSGASGIAAHLGLRRWDPAKARRPRRSRSRRRRSCADQRRLGGSLGNDSDGRR